MANLIKLHHTNSIEYTRLLLFRNFANKILYDNSMYMDIKETYFDMGQDWKYTTLITTDLKGRESHWQSFCPRDYELIITCDSISKMKEMAEYYANFIIKRDGSFDVHLYSKYE